MSTFPVKIKCDSNITLSQCSEMPSKNRFWWLRHANFEGFIRMARIECWHNLDTERQLLPGEYVIGAGYNLNRIRYNLTVAEDGQYCIEQKKEPLFNEVTDYMFV